MSRRRRKRGRRQATDAGAGRGDRRPAPPRGPGGPFGLWLDATPSDLALLRRAIREGWPVPAGRRASLLSEVAAGLDSAAPRHAIAVVRTMLEADRANLHAAQPPH